MSPDDQRIHLIVLFGGQSAEHDISCTTAAHVLRAADPAKDRITPIGIGRDGRWSVAAGAQAALARGPDALPGHLDAAVLGVAARGRRDALVLRLHLLRRRELW